MAKFVRGIFGPITGRLGGKSYSWSEEHGAAGEGPESAD